MDFIEVVTEPILNWAKDSYVEIITTALAYAWVKYIMYPKIQDWLDRINGR